MSETTYHLTNCRCLGSDDFEERDLWIRGGSIVAGAEAGVAEIDMQGALIAPGLIDIQINGGYGIDFTLEPERVDEVAARLPQEGVVAFCPTVISAAAQCYERALPALTARKQDKHAEILGAHLEGPLIQPAKKGAHPEEALVTRFEVPEAADIRIVTLAPELAGAERLVAELSTRGIIVAGGHSTASFAETEAAVEAGMRLVTHLFNAMSGLHHREPGLVGAALTDERLRFSLIADGYHLHPSVLLIAYRSAAERLLLVSDATAAMGLPDGSYRLGEQDIEVRSGCARLANSDILAGSASSLLHCVQELAKATGDKAHALRAASERPARLLGEYPRRGSLMPGAEADFLVLDDSLCLQQVWVNGAPLNI